MPYIRKVKAVAKRKSARGKCVDPGAKPNWSAPHREVKSSFNGEKLMTTRYVDKSRRKKGKLTDGWRGYDPTTVCEAAKTPERLGILPPQWFRRSSELLKQKG